MQEGFRLFLQCVSKCYSFMCACPLQLSSKSVCVSPSFAAMGASQSRTDADVSQEDLADGIDLALALAMSLEAPPGIPAAPPVAPAAPPVAPAAPEAAAAAEGSDGQYLRLCQVCNTVSYLRQGVCLNPGCRLSYLQDTPQNVGARLQSWGPEKSQETATVDQLEGARKRRQGSSWYDKQGNPKRSKGWKQRQLSQSFAAGKHPRTGVDTWKPIQRHGKWWIWSRETHWKAFDTYEEALAARSPAPAEAAATPEDAASAAEPEAAKAAPSAYKTGSMAGLVPLWAKAAPPVKEFAYNQMRRTLEEQEHYAMANYGMATSARPPAPWRMPQPAPPAPEAPKAAAVPEGSFALAPTPIKAMPPRPDTMSHDQVLNYMAGAISQHLLAALMQGHPMAMPPAGGIFIRPAPKMRALAAPKPPPPKAPAVPVTVPGDSTDEEEGEGGSRD